MLFDVFINREHELASAIHLHDEGNGRQVTLIVGPTGIGKSEFTAELVRRSACLAIRVPCPTPVNRSSLKDGVFIRNLSDWVDRHSAPLGIRTMETFANKIGTTALTEDYHKRLLEDGRRLPGVPAVSAVLTMFKRFTGHAYRRAEMYRPAASWEPIIHYDYLLNTLYDLPITIILENFQIIDYESQNLIQSLMWKLQRASWILEYTASAPYAEPLGVHEELGKYLRQNVNFLKLSPLPLDRILLARGSQNIDLVSLFTLQYKTCEGNLRIMADAALLSDTPNDAVLLAKTIYDNPQINATSFRLERLPSDSVVILALIVAGQAKLEARTLEAAVHYLPDAIKPVHRESIFAYLANEGFVERKQESLYISHDTITENLSSVPSWKIVLALARKALENLYVHWSDNPAQSPLESPEVSRRLLALQVINDPLSVLADMERLRKAILYSSVRQDSKQFLENFTAALELHAGVSSKAWWSVAKVSYDAGFFAFALSLTAKMAASSHNALLRAFILHNLDRNEEALAQVDGLLAEHRSAASFVAATTLKMICLRAIGDISSARRNADILYDKPWAMKTLEYGYFLRDLECLVGPQDGLAHLHASVDFFLSSGDLHAAAQTRTNLAMQFARLGQLDQASRQLDLAEEYGDLRISDRFLIWNNRAAISLLRGECTQEARLYLERALLSTDASFDRLTIKQNLMIWSLRHGDSNTAASLAEEILVLLKSERDPHENAAAATNLAYFYSTQGNETQARYWNDRLYQFAKLHDVGYQEYWLRRAANSSCEHADSAEFAFLASLPYHLSFLAHWSFPIVEPVEREQ